MATKNKIFFYSIAAAFTLLLLVFCILILVKNKTFKEEYSFELFLPPEKFYEEVCGCSLEKILSFRNFKSYELASNESQNKILFKQIESDVKNMVRNNDSKNGIHVSLNAKTKYGEVVKVLVICKTEKVQTYILQDYDIWIMTGSNSELNENCCYKMSKP